MTGNGSSPGNLSEAKKENQCRPGKLVAFFNPDMKLHDHREAPMCSLPYHAMRRSKDPVMIGHYSWRCAHASSD